MTVVVKLVQYTCKDTIAVLKALLALAIKGKLRGLALCYRTEDGREEPIFTGIYKARPEFAASAGMKLSRHLNDEFPDSRFGP